MKTTTVQPHQSSLGMSANIVALVIYVAMAVLWWIPFFKYLIWVVPLAVYFMEKNSAFVKFHAVQALVIGVARAVIAIIFAMIYGALMPRDIMGLINHSSLGAIRFVSFLDVIVTLAITVLAVYLLIMAYGYKQVELPVIGPIAAKTGEKLGGVNLSQPAGKDPEQAGPQNVVICPACGHANPQGTSFCGNCGNKLE